MSDKPSDIEESQLFELLDQYVAALPDDKHNLRADLLRQHPRLAELIDCLDTLEQMVPGSRNEPSVGVIVPPGSLSALPGHLDEQFGNFLLQGELGRGGMGVVYRAQQCDLNRTVALKMILSSRLASKEDIRRFSDEAKAAASLKHPNIVGIHEVGELHGQHYFTMDFVAGPSLAELLHDGPLKPERAAKLLETIARAVDYLHCHHIVHRDLKPSNILLDDRGEPYVTDFGLAKVFASDRLQTPTGAVLGTPSYMSPEQASGRHTDVTPRCDVYSLGAILYEMLTGRPPFKEQTHFQTLVQVIEGEPPLPRRLNPRIPRELELICLRALERDPNDRYVSAADFADDLERFLQDQPVTATPSGLFHRLKRWSRRKPALASHLASLAAASAIVQVRYSLRGVDAGMHWTVMGIFAAWAAVSFGFQYLLERDVAPNLARYAWLAADVLLLTLLLTIADPPLGYLLIGYPLLIAASGMFFQVRMVTFTTCVALASYAALQWYRSDEGPTHYPLIFAAALAVLGFIIGFQVHRVRILTRYCEGRRHG